jgi:tRNA/rRNA methyltransferase
MNSLTANTHVVLVNTQNSLNVGSVLRAMSNLGFKHLHLVAPEDYQERKVRVTACNAANLVEGIQFHESIEGALAEMQDVVGFSARDGRNRMRSFWLPEWSKECARSGEQFPRTALVFGPEDNGLSQEHLSHCRSVVTIPTAGDYSSFNLSQAVLLALYQLFNDCAGSDQQQYDDGTLNAGEPAEWKEFYYLDSIVDAVLEASHFFRDGTPTPVPLIVKRLLRRTNPDKREMGILLGMFRRIEGVLVGRVPVKENLKRYEM